jgi:hypothetical protein
LGRLRRVVMQAHGRGKESCRAARNQLPMTEHEASRTLVKSTPELWAECSDAASLAKHLGAFGEIRITKLEPETAVAWEGEDVRGTVTLEPSGWGTRVILTAVPLPGGDAVEDAPAAESIPEVPDPAVAGPPPKFVDMAEDAQPDPVLPEPVLPEPVLPEPALPEASQPMQEPEAPVAERSGVAPRQGFWRRLFGGRRPAPAVVSESKSAARFEASVQPEAADEAEESRAAEPLAVEPPAEPVRPEPDAPPAEPAAAALLEALDSLGRAHHRPYSRG